MSPRISGYFRMLALAALVLWAPSVSLGGGLFLYEIATTESALSSAGWAARAQDASTVFTNPAGMTRIEDSTLQAGLQSIFINVEFEADAASGGGSTDAGGILPAASVFWVGDVGELGKVGMAALSYLGLELDYGDSWAGRYYFTEGGVRSLSLLPSGAYKINDRLSVGGGLNIMVAQLEANAAVANVDPGLGDGAVEFYDTEWGYGINLGLLYEFSDSTRAGLSYLSQVKFDFSDELAVEGVGPTMLAALQAAGLAQGEVDATMRSPHSLMASVYHDLGGFALMANLGWQRWSVFLETDEALSVTPFATENGYKNTWHASLGGQVELSPLWRLDLGLAYDSTLKDDGHRTPYLPLGEMWRAGLGAAYGGFEGWKIAFAANMVWMGDLSMEVSAPPMAPPVSGSYDNNFLSTFNVNATYIF